MRVAASAVAAIIMLAVCASREPCAEHGGPAGRREIADTDHAGIRHRPRRGAGNHATEARCAVPRTRSSGNRALCFAESRRKSPARSLSRPLAHRRASSVRSERSARRLGLLRANGEIHRQRRVRRRSRRRPRSRDESGIIQRCDVAACTSDLLARSRHPTGTVLRRIPIGNRVLWPKRAIPPELRWSWIGAQDDFKRYRSAIAGSNSAFRNAEQTASLVLANHFLSAVDAYVSVRMRIRRNLDGSQTLSGERSVLIEERSLRCAVHCVLGSAGYCVQA